MRPMIPIFTRRIFVRYYSFGAGISMGWYVIFLLCTIQPSRDERLEISFQKHDAIAQEQRAQYTSNLNTSKRRNNEKFRCYRLWG